MIMYCRRKPNGQARNPAGGVGTHTSTRTVQYSSQSRVEGVEMPPQGPATPRNGPHRATSRGSEMDAVDIIAQCREVAAVLTLEGESVMVRSPRPVPPRQREALESARNAVVACLSACRELACECYRLFKMPIWRGKVSCRWVWPAPHQCGRDRGPEPNTDQEGGER